MSNLSRFTVYWPTNVKLELKNVNSACEILWISGEYGTWFYKVNRREHLITILQNNSLSIKSTSKFFHLMKYYYSNRHKTGFPMLNSNLSLLAVLLKRMIVGAGVGFKKYLRVRGVGYKFEIKKFVLLAKVGYTHSLQKTLPSEFYTKFSRKAKVIRFRSKSLSKLTGFLSTLRALRKPDIYKGKGIRYKQDLIRCKPGKRKTKAVSKKKTYNNKDLLLHKFKKKRKKRKQKISFKKKLNVKN